jgi:fumarate hydratase class I
MAEGRRCCVRGGLAPHAHALAITILMHPRGLSPGSERTHEELLAKEAPMGGRSRVRERHAARRFFARRQSEILRRGRVLADLPGSGGEHRFRLPRGCSGPTMAAMHPEATDLVPWRRLDGDFVATGECDGEAVLRVRPEALETLAREAFRDCAHFLRPGHLAQLRAILDDPEASANDRFVALDLLRNAAIAAEGVLPMCQDTGTAIVMGWKGQRVWTGGGDEAALARGVERTYAEANLRYSQLAPLGMCEEKNTGSNLPAQVDLYADDGDEYRFLFLAKGGGSANKTFLHQATPALLREDLLLKFLEEKIPELGTAACPPYHLAVVIGGTSAEACLKAVKLASARALDGLPARGSAEGGALRLPDWEAKVLAITRGLGIGAQFGGKHFCHDVRVIRLPRHGASLPIGIGVSCSADRQILGKITRAGVFLEALERDPARFLPEARAEELSGDVVRVDLDRPMDEIRARLAALPVRTRLSLTGTLVVARDLAHARLREMALRGEELPEWFRAHPVYYAGPAKTPPGMPSGAFGPTTAGRMDSFVDFFQERGASLVMLAKGNRSRAVAQACKKHGGFYLGTIGGSAARVARECIRKAEVLAFPDLGMEAAWRIEVEDFPAFVVTDCRGNDFFLGDGAA